LFSTFSFDDNHFQKIHHVVQLALAEQIEQRKREKELQKQREREEEMRLEAKLEKYGCFHGLN
jgi:hypothetical protein